MQLGKKMFMATTGSTLYGYRLQGSDRNFFAICMPSPDDIKSGDVRLSTGMNNGKAGAERESTMLFSPASFLRAAAAGDCYALEAAFITGECLQWEDDNGKAIRAYVRDHLVTKSAVKAIADGVHVLRQTIQLTLENFNQSTFCIAIREAVQATALAKFATFSPALKNPLKDTVWRVRRGRVSVEDALALLDEIIDQMDKAVATTTLDLEPDMTALEACITDVHTKLLIHTEG